MREFLQKLPLLGPLVAKAWSRYYKWTVHPTQRLRRLLGGKRGLSVVQIGSNDGKAGDPIRPLLRANRSWTALFVEPVPFLFERLKANYAGEARFRFEQAAIAETAAVLPFFYIGEEAWRQHPETPKWYDQLGSFNRALVERHAGTKIAPYIVQADLQAVPLADVLARHQIERIDLLHIDTEGYDWVVLRQLDFAKYQPAVIMFEHKHLTPEARAEARAFVAERYEVTDLGYDFLCRRIGYERKTK